MSGDHSHATTSNPKRLVIALTFTGTFLIAEVMGGVVYGSLALLSDAAHIFRDVVALTIALVAIKVGARSADDSRLVGNTMRATFTIDEIKIGEAVKAPLLYRKEVK